MRFSYRNHWYSGASILDIDIKTLSNNSLSPFLDKLESLFKSMEREFEDTATYYGFSCEGCDDNCCLSLFYHHTLAEYFFIEKGLAKLPAHERSAAFARADAYASTYAASPGREKPLRLMCPLNVSGMCMLYGFRPMICRLFGLPHEFTQPGRGRMSGPGCSRFHDLCGEKEYRRFDRTPYYMSLACLEKSLREATGISGKIKMTVADMMVCMERGGVSREANSYQLSAISYQLMANS